MKRKIPVLIGIVLALAIALAACQSQIQPSIPGNQTDPLPSHVENHPEAAHRAASFYESYAINSSLSDINCPTL